MGLIRHYLRVFIRSNFRPVNPKLAKKWEINTSVMYALFAWTAFGVAIYSYYQNSEENQKSLYGTGKAFTPYQSIRKFGRTDDATVIRIKGFSVEKEVLTYDEAREKSRE